MDRESVAIEAMLERGLPLPDWAADPPEIPQQYEFLIAEFWKLSSERQLGMSVGSIPISKIDERGERHGFDDAMMGLYQTVIRSLDRTFLSWLDSEREKRNKQKPDGRLPNQNQGRHKRR